MLQCVALFVAVCCSVLQCVAVSRTLCKLIPSFVMSLVCACCTRSVCCSVLQCVVVCCSEAPTTQAHDLFQLVACLYVWVCVRVSTFCVWRICVYTRRDRLGEFWKGEERAGAV